MKIRILLAAIAAAVSGLARSLRVVPPGIDVCNSNGEHDGGISRLAEVAIAPYLLVTFGTNPATQVKLNTAATRPIGTAYDEAAAGSRVGVIPVANGKPRLVIASKAIAAGVRVYGTAGGKVTDAVVAGAYLVGESISIAGADGDELEIIPLSPVVNP